MGKAVVAAFIAILILAMVVAAVVTAGMSKNSPDNGVNSSNKAVDALCASTDYKETCHRSLSNATATDPKLLIKAAFEYAVENIGGVIKNSTVIKEASSDKATKEALQICEDVLGNAVDDLKRSFDGIGELDYGDIDDIMEDIKVWLSAVGTNQETCIDAFENTTGDTGEKMKELLKTAKELTSNGLAMVSGASMILSQLGLGDFNLNLDQFKGFNRDSIETSQRKLISSSDNSIKLTKKQVSKRRLVDSSEAVSPSAAVTPTKLVVSQDGSGEFKSVLDAIKTIPQPNDQPFVIYVKAGVYKENVNIPKYMNKIVLIGEGPLKTRISSNLSYADGIATYHTATFVVEGDDFMAKDIAFENSAGPEKFQAVALRCSGDHAVFHNVHVDGYQDSLYAHIYRQYYRDCRITGTIDFVFGDGLALFQNCKFIVRKPLNSQACMLTAQGRMDPRSTGAIIIQNGVISADPEFLSMKPAVKAYLGRPWKALSRTIILESQIDGFIAPEGWAPWNEDNYALETLYYAEYMNRGSGSGTGKRVGWKGIQQFDQEAAERWTGEKVFVDDLWIKNTSVPYNPSWI